MDPISREPVEVIEFQRARLRASPTIVAGERAAPTVALEHCPLDGVRNASGSLSRRILPGRRAGFAPDCEPLLLHVFDQRVEGCAEDFRQVSIRNPVADEVLCLAELLVEFLVGRELDLE